jgi:hypothetical protein
MLPDPVARFRGVFLPPPGCDVFLDSDAVGSVLGCAGDGVVCRVREEVGATGNLQVRGKREDAEGGVVTLQKCNSSARMPVTGRKFHKYLVLNNLGHVGRDHQVPLDVAKSEHLKHISNIMAG